MKWTTPAGEIYTLYKSMLKESHLLIGGATGSGKSVVINALIYTALYKAPTEAAFVLCDTRMVELSRYAKLPHVLRYADTLSDITNALQMAHALMMDRFKAMKRSGHVETADRDIYVIVDELADLVTKGANRQENALRKSCEGYIESIGKLGRAAHVHLILTTQAPNRQTLKANIVLNVTARLALHCDSSIESRQMIGRSGAEFLPKYGQGIYKTPEGMDTWNLPMIPQEDISERIKWWTNQNGFLSKLFRTAW